MATIKMLNNNNISEAIDNLNTRADIARENNIELSMALSRESAETAKQAGYKKGLAKAYLNSGYCSRLLANFERAIEFFENSLQIYRAISDKTGESRALNALANVYLNLSNFEKAIEYYSECIYKLQSIGDLRFEAAVLSNRGLAYQQLGNLRASLNNFLESFS